MPPRPALPVIASCDGCGACCRVVATPPFVRHLDGTGEDAWERLRWDRPDLRAALLDAERAHQPLGPPCPWFDPATARCRHYDHRPRACRDFAVGGVDCLDTRRRAGIG